MAPARRAHLATRPFPSQQIIWAVGLLAAANASTVTSTYAGQVVMDGYFNWKAREGKSRRPAALVLWPNEGGREAWRRRA